MKKSYPNSKECTIAILKDNYGWNDPEEPVSSMNYIRAYLEKYKKYFKSEVDDKGFTINHNFSYKGVEWQQDIRYTYNPDSDFASFASSASTHDGTLLFVAYNIENCIQDLI